MRKKASDERNVCRTRPASQPIESIQNKYRQYYFEWIFLELSRMHITIVYGEGGNMLCAVYER